MSITINHIPELLQNHPNYYLKQEPLDKTRGQQMVIDITTSLRGGYGFIFGVSGGLLLYTSPK